MHSRLPFLAFLWLAGCCHLASLVPGKQEVAHSPDRSSSAVQARVPAESSLVVAVSDSRPAEEATAELDSTQHLQEAARLLEKDNLKEAEVHLAHYLEQKPDAIAVRVQYAELLVGLNRKREASKEFEHFLADAQERRDYAAPTIVHVHRRLMEVAEDTQDDYSEHLHRGIGLYLLACQRARIKAEETELSAEALLCRAAAELTLARGSRPGEARPCLYLFEVWSLLGQRHPAVASLRQAQSVAWLSYLTPAESRRLQVVSMDAEPICPVR